MPAMKKLCVKTLTIGFWKQNFVWQNSFFFKILLLRFDKTIFFKILLLRCHKTKFCFQNPIVMVWQNKMLLSKSYCYGLTNNFVFKILLLRFDKTIFFKTLLLRFDKTKFCFQNPIVTVWQNNFVFKILLLRFDKTKFCFQNPIITVWKNKILFSKSYCYGLDTMFFHYKPNKICSHTTEPTTTMYFKWLF
jgi:hypothetical protein